MVSQKDSYVFIGINESDESSSPADRRGYVEKSKNAHLEDNKPEKYDINELYHFLDC